MKRCATPSPKSEISYLQFNFNKETFRHSFNVATVYPM